jgi:multiple sugar transport system substrate-binding protein
MRFRQTVMGAALVVMVCAACGGGGGSSDQQEIVMITSGTVFEATGGEQGLVKEFEEATGIHVRVVVAELPGLYEKMNASFTSSSARYDVVAFEDAGSNEQLWKNLAPLNDYIDDAGDDYDLDDFISTGLEVSKAPDGSQYGIPLRLSSYIMYYRSDLLSGAGLDQFPTTWDELLDVAADMKTEERAGMMQRGASPDSGVDFLSVLASHNGRLLNEDNTACTLTSDEGVDAAEDFVTIFRDLSPRGAVAAGRDDYTVAYQQGRSAMSIFSSSYFAEITDPEKSDFGVDVTGYSPVPAANGAEVGASRIAAWSLGITEKSENKDAAWQLIEMMTNPENQLEIAMEHGNGPSRSSVYESAEYQEAFPPAETVLTALEVAVRDPALPETSAMRTILAAHLSEAIVGDKTPEQAMTEACGEIDDLLT